MEQILENRNNGGSLNGSPDNIVNNPLPQLARVYALLEKVLRQKAFTMRQLNAIPDLLAAQKSPWQIRDCTKNLLKKGYVVATYFKHPNDTTYTWDKDAAPFVFGAKESRRASRRPSPVETKTVSAALPEAAQPAYALTAADNSELELDFRGTKVVIGRNAKTGRMPYCD